MTLEHIQDNTGEVMDRCPFCKVAGATLDLYREGYFYFVGCTNCKAEGSHRYTAEEAIETWNSVERAN